MRLVPDGFERISAVAVVDVFVDFAV